MQMQAIVTTYHGPGNRIGARIKAKASAGYVWHAYDPRAWVCDTRDSRDQFSLVGEG